MRVFFITDKRSTYDSFKRITKNGYEDFVFDCFYSKGDATASTEFEHLGKEIQPICLKEKDFSFFDCYDVFFAWHCRQLFPPMLVKNYRCVNLHPSLSPYNRGWYPQVFSLYNGYPAGVTIHEMDANIDMGFIICQHEVPKYSTDTAKELYDRIVIEEEKLVSDNLRNVLCGHYKKEKSGEGNINYKKDFVELCKIDLNKQASYKEVIDYLRAFSFKGYKNAYFIDDEGNKIYIEISLSKGDN